MKKNNFNTNVLAVPPGSVTRTPGKAWWPRRSRSCARQSTRFEFFFFITNLFFLVFCVSCETPTRVYEKDSSLEGRVFSKVEYGSPEDLKRSVIIDVRSKFDHEMSKPPRSFHVNVSDWDLKFYTGKRLAKKTEELQRLLSLKGIEPPTQVVVLGPGLSGKGEEFLMAHTLFRLGLMRVNLLTHYQMKNALITKNLPLLENVPKWTKPLKPSLQCESNNNLKDSDLEKKSDIVVKLPKKYFTKDLKVTSTRYPKTMRPRVFSPDSYWSYGVALHLKEQGLKACIY